MKGQPPHSQKGAATGGQPIRPPTGAGPTRRAKPDPNTTPHPDAQTAQRLIRAELQQAEHQQDQDPEFSAALIPPRKITVNFAGGFTQPCYLVARPKGPYSVVYMPKAGYFSLCVASMFGPVDIGVHGRAMDCYASV